MNLNFKFDSSSQTNCRFNASLRASSHVEKWKFYESSKYFLLYRKLHRDFKPRAQLAERLLFRYLFIPNY